MVTRVDPDNAAQPVVPLEYAQPHPRQRSPLRDLAIAVLISVVLSTGVGSLTFGVLMEWGWRDDHAAPVAFGLGLIVLALAMTGLILYFRRAPR